MFLRRKRSNIHDVVVSQPVPQAQVTSAPSTPLYERFATTAKGAAPSPTSPGRSSAAISRPMALGVKPGNAGVVSAVPARVGSDKTISISPPKPTQLSGRSRYYRDHEIPPPASHMPRPQTRVTDEWSSDDDEAERYGGQQQAQAQQPPRMMMPLSPPTSPGAQKRLAKVKSRETKKTRDATRLPTPPSPRSKPLPPPKPEAPIPRLVIPSSTSSESGSSSYGTPTPTGTPHLPAQPFRSALSSPSPASNSTPTMADETGFVVQKSPSNEPALGNSLTSRAPPMRRKYSPLAAFGPSTDEPKVPPPPSIILSSSTSEGVSGSDVRLHANSSAVPPPSSSALAGSASFPEGSSPSKVDLSGRHESFQPLKTASVELRVTLNPEERQFHSPLFAARMSTSNVGDSELQKTVDGASPNGIPPAIQHAGASEDKAKNRVVSERKNVISPTTRHEMNGLNGAGLGRSARTLPPVPSSPLPSTSPSKERPSVPHSVPSDQTRLSEPSRSASSMRQRTTSASSASSNGNGKQHARLAKLPDERMRPLPPTEILYETGPSRQASSESVSGKARQIPTPPTSVDGHSIKSGKGASAKGAQQDAGMPSASDGLNILGNSSDVERNGGASAGDNVNPSSHSPSHAHTHSPQAQTSVMPLTAPSSRRARSGSSSRKAADAISNAFGGHTPRKLYKQPPAVHMVTPQPVESPIDLATGAEMPKDADPFAKGEVLHTPTVATTTQPSKASVGLPSPESPGEYSAARTKRRGERLEKRPKEVVEATVRDQGAAVGLGVTNDYDVHDERQTPHPHDGHDPSQGLTEEDQELPEEEREPTFYPLEQHLTTQPLLAALLPYLTFSDWCLVTEVNDAMRRTVEHRRDLRETVLEHYLSTVGYTRWKWPKKEPILLTFRDLNSYMRGVSVPTHQYANTARAWLETKVMGDPDRTVAVQKTLLASSCRAYTRVVLRLRAQAEADADEVALAGPPARSNVYQFSPPESSVSVNAPPHSRHPTQGSSRAKSLSRPPSPNSSVGHSHSVLSHSHSNLGHAQGRSEHGRYASSSSAGRPVSQFRSPLFRIGHSPFLRVFVPNPEGEWLSDQSVLDCEKELKRAGVLPLLRAGDVVWDAAVGDEGNVGRMVWDGNYLIDLDYKYSSIGDLPQYVHTLAFPPSYFHRVIRTNGNPTCYIDISPWGEEIAANLQLLQDRIQTETPQGGRHTVVRWIHRSRFRIRPNPFTNAPIPIPGTLLSIDPGWYGHVIVETEGTNEGLADLQDRCKGNGFPPRAGVPPNKTPSKVYRLLRERSRPGEIWIRTVGEKDRYL